jgi:hypothetical protein
MRVEAALLGCALLACAGQHPPEARPMAGGASELQIGQTMEGALEADGRGDPGDSLYAPYATLIADGRLRRGVPRYAGLAAGGEVAITNTQLQIRGTVAWGTAEYRWAAGRGNAVSSGRASFVLVPAQGRQGWWIVQAHSSTQR